jgi:hypothetical protein
MREDNAAVAPVVHELLETAMDQCNENGNEIQLVHEESRRLDPDPSPILLHGRPNVSTMRSTIEDDIAKQKLPVLSRNDDKQCHCSQARKIRDYPLNKKRLRF